MSLVTQMNGCPAAGLRTRTTFEIKTLTFGVAREVVARMITPPGLCIESQARIRGDVDQKVLPMAVIERLKRLEKQEDIISQIGEMTAAFSYCTDRYGVRIHMASDVNDQWVKALIPSGEGMVATVSDIDHYYELVVGHNGSGTIRQGLGIMTGWLRAVGFPAAELIPPSGSIPQDETTVSLLHGLRMSVAPFVLPEPRRWEVTEEGLVDPLGEGGDLMLRPARFRSGIRLDFSTVDGLPMTEDQMESRNALLRKLTSTMNGQSSQTREALSHSA